MTFGGWPDVRTLGVLKQKRKVDIKFLRQKCFVGPPMIEGFNRRNILGGFNQSLIREILRGLLHEIINNIGGERGGIRR